MTDLAFPARSRHLIRVTTVVAAIVTASLGAPAARADSVGADVLLEQTTLVSANQANVYSFNAPSAGTVDIKLENLAWPTQLQSLTAAILTPTGAVGSFNAAGDMVMSVSGPKQLAAYVDAQASGGLNLGLYSLDVTFVPSGATVPLPATATLILGGLGLLLGLGRRHEEVAPQLSPI